MGTNYWMFVETEENASITRELGYKLFGMGPRYRKRAQRMQKNDRVLFYTRTTMNWTATATITSECFEDSSQVWEPKSKPSDFKFRIELKPDFILRDDEYIDGLQLGPSLEYVKRWSPENWPLAFWDKLHLLPQRDFKLLESEIMRIKTGEPGELLPKNVGTKRKRSPRNYTAKLTIVPDASQSESVN